ncbi:MAG: hypothetical protein VX733_02885 [Candidatus Latescibacterota bacterium]|nr:hypothetical protein [Candidatus Latescibacterota bacterium]
MAASALWLLAAVSRPASAQFGAPFLDVAHEPRALGMGAAMAAVADGPSAVFHNPAGLAASRGRALSASYQSLSLDRSVESLAGSMNLRGGLAFGLAWIHAGVDGLVSRTGAGDQIDGQIEDGQNAVLFALGSELRPGLMVGVGIKILRHRIEVPFSGESSASGRAWDVGARYALGANTSFAVTIHNLMDQLTWTVERNAEQTSRSEDEIGQTFSVAVAHRLVRSDRHLLIAADLQSAPHGTRAHVGAEAILGPLIILRAGLHRIGDFDATGQPAFGLSLQPMRRREFTLHYSWVADELDAGARSLIGISSLF